MTMTTNFDGFLVNVELNTMRRYLNMVRRSLSNEYQKLEQDFKSEMENEFEDYEDIDDIKEHYWNLLAEFEREFPKLIFGSFIIAWYSFVEQKLLDICEDRELRLSFSAKENINFGKGIWRAKKFLSKAANCEIDEKLWQELVNINHFRNFIVHVGYQLTLTNFQEYDFFATDKVNKFGANDFNIDKDLAKYLENHLMIQYSGFFLYVVPTIDYCEHLISFGQEFFESLFSKLGEDTKRS